MEEFFELFKTPWEFYRHGRAYDTILATADELPSVQPRLLLIYGANPAISDVRLGILASARQATGILDDQDGGLPIYTGLVTFQHDGAVTPCVRSTGATAGIRTDTVIRLGYDLFDEVEFLLSRGQPVEHASVPALDIHIRMLREWILKAGIPLLEIPPAPPDRSFIACLTHDIDFIGIRQHFFDHSMWGFVLRAMIGAFRNFLRGRISTPRLLKSWGAVASLPFVYAGWLQDFWEPFEWYLNVEKGLSPTYFLIPFKRRAGVRVPGRHASRRASAYGAEDVRAQAQLLLSQGCEVGVHGIDSWHDAVKGAEEKAAVVAVAGDCSGIRMHWLLHDENTAAVLEHAGYGYDSTCGYNETIGYRAGTTQVFRPLGAHTLLELPLHIQDGALFYPQRLDLSETEAEKRCQALIANARKSGGVLTLLWHDRSHGPERFWGEFYCRLVGMLKLQGAWFGTANQVVGWFRQRRAMRFEFDDISGQIRIRYTGDEIRPRISIQYHRQPPGATATETIDISWDGKSLEELTHQMGQRFSSNFTNLAQSTLS